MTPAEIIERIHNRASETGVESLSLRERFVWAIASADFETNLGGAAGYLYNSSGDHLPLLATAFDTIGCPLLAQNARSLLDCVGQHCVPTDRSARAAAVNSASDPLSAAMDAFESGIQDCADDYGDKLEVYINSWC